MNQEPPPIITLTTDLGEQEPFVASIKGVLLRDCPGTRIVDLAHQISPHDVTGAALFLLGSVPFFPPGTVHLVSVAPGPRPIVLKIAGQYVVCPDNGISTLLSRHLGAEGGCGIAMPDSLANCGRQISFGREVFAPAAAAIAKGKPLTELGEPLSKTEQIDWPDPLVVGKSRVDGAVMHVDRFGNLVTNIYQSQLANLEVDRIEAGNSTAHGLSCSYDDVEPGRCLALIGHAGYLEVAYNRDRASDRTGLKPGIKVQVHLKSR